MRSTKRPEYLREHAAFVEGRAGRGISAPGESRPVFSPDLNHARRIEAGVRAMAQRMDPSDGIANVIGASTTWDRRWLAGSHSRGPISSARWS